MSAILEREEVHQHQVISILDREGYKLPTILGKPYKPPKTIQPYDMDVTCDKDDCKSPLPKPHTHTKRINPGPDGTGRLERKASGEIVYHAPWTKKPKPFAMVDLKPRIETPSKALARLKKECVTTIDAARGLNMCSSDGYVTTATNGHWALMEPGVGAGSVNDKALGIHKKAHLTVIESPEFYLALQRAKTMVEERTNMVRLTGIQGHGVTLHSSVADAGDFAEDVQAVVTKSFEIGFNLDYLNMAVGSWPLHIWIRDTESAVTFEPATRDWRLVVMPMRLK